MKCKDCDSLRKGWFEHSLDDYVCIGVKEPFIVKDINSDCTEYRGENFLMNTAEMWLKAQKDGKIYECVDGNIAYSKEYGLTDKYDFNYAWNLKAWESCGAYGLDALLGDCKWQEMNNIMTIAEAEEKFGIKIVQK